MIAKRHERRVITSRQLLMEGEGSDDGMQMEVRIRAVAERGNSSWSHTSVPIRGQRAAKLTKIELQLCPAKKAVEIEVHAADLMVGGIMRLSAKIQQLHVVDGVSSRITARVSASLRLAFANSTEVLLPMSLNNDELQLNFKAKLVKTVEEEQIEQWQASVRPVVSAPVDADSSFWSLLYSATVNCAQAQLELSYSAGTPGSKFLPVGLQEFTVRLQRYDPVQSQRLDLKPEFVLPKHALVTRAVELLLDQWGASAAPVEANEVWSAVSDMAACCFATQGKIVNAMLAVRSPTVNAQLIQALESMADCSSQSDSTDDGQPDTADDATAGRLLSSVVEALAGNADDAQLRPFPSPSFVTISILASLGSFRSSRPQLGAIADYLQYRMHVYIDSRSLVESFSVETAVNATPAPAATMRLPQMVSDLVHNHGEEWDKYLTPLVQVDTDESSGLPESLKHTVVETLLALLLSGETVNLLDPADDETSGWAFRCSRVGSAELIRSSCAFMAICQKTELGRLEPLILIPVSMGRTGHSMAVRMTASTNMFFSPNICTDLLPMSGSGVDQYRNTLQKWLGAAMRDQQKFECSAVLYVTSGERASDRTAESPILDLLQHHLAWSRSSTVSAYGLMTGGVRPQGVPMPREDTASAPSLQSWQLSNPCQVGDADASQRHAIAGAVAGKSFVLRGPPGCGKTQTLANMVAALVDAGKTVCVVAKLPVALGVFADKLRGMQQNKQNTAPALRPLTTAFFTGKDGGKIRLGDDGQNAITHDDRLQRWPVVRDLERFWSCTESGTESDARMLLREGWRLPSSQPEFLHRFQKEGVVGVQLVKNKNKPKYVCSLCGKTQASEAPFAKHMEAHLCRDSWHPLFDKRQAYEKPHWQADNDVATESATHGAAVATQLDSATSTRLAADSELHKLDVQAWHACRALHSVGDQTGTSGRCGEACTGGGCCVSEMTSFEMMSSVAKGAVRVVALQTAHNAAAAEDLGFYQLAQEFAECRECCNTASGCCHSVLETVHAVKGASHSSVFSILSLAAAQAVNGGNGASGRLQEQVYQALQDVRATPARLQFRCELFELCFQLAYLRTVSEQILSDKAADAVSPWVLELQRRQACLDAVSVGCEARLLKFLLQHPHVSEEMEAAFGVRNSGAERARRLTELLYPSLVDVNSPSDGEDPAVRLRLLLSMFPVFCFTPEECMRHLPGVMPGTGESDGQPVFDVVLFDEASQLPTYEALGCLGRAAQCIIVGDDQQLPPRDGCTGLLDDALVANMSLVPLTWHYRSAFRSLIHVSNEMFYHGSLQCVPSANDFLSTTGCDVGNAGLIRQQVNGPMESNYNCQREIQDFINKRLRRLDPSIDETVNYTATPQGFVNSEQAWRVVEELTRYMDAIRADGRPMSAGIITLNRPQRQLIQLLVGAAATRLGLVDTHSNSFARPDEDAHVQDQPLFIASIDQIQGEEREIILLSMLLAPRRQSGQAMDTADDEEGVDIFDQLEAQAAPEDDTGGEDANDGPAAAPARSAPTAQRFQYSTIAHAHGDRLLNVGLSRAISVMKIFYHPRMVAPPEHDVKNGKRVFGWLVRFLLKQPPSCSCSECAGRYRRLVPESAAAAEDPEGTVAAEGLQAADPELWSAVESALHRCDSSACFGAGSAVGSTAIGFGGGSAHIAVAVQLKTVAGAAPKAIAMLADSSAGRNIAARDKTSLPAMLQNRKVGWESCAALQTEDLFQRLAAAGASDSGAGALGSAVKSWVEDALHKAASAEKVVVQKTDPLPSLFDVPDAPTPVEGYVPPTVVVKSRAEDCDVPAGGATPAAALKSMKEPKKAGAKKGMTVAQLKEELKRRGLARTGKKAELEARLQAAVDAETAAAAEHGAEDSEDDAVVDETVDVIAVATSSKPGVAPVKLADLPAPAPAPAAVPMAEPAELEPVAEPELEPELPSAVNADEVLAAMTGSEDDDSDDDAAFEDVYSPEPGENEHDWEVTAIIRQPDAEEDWGATATIPIKTISAVAVAGAAAAEGCKDTTAMNESVDALVLAESSEPELASAPPVKQDCRPAGLARNVSVPTSEMPGKSAMQKRLEAAASKRLAVTQGSDPTPAPASAAVAERERAAAEAALVAEAEAAQERYAAGLEAQAASAPMAEPELEPELSSELPSAVNADEVLAAMAGSEDENSDDDTAGFDDTVLDDTVGFASPGASPCVPLAAAIATTAGAGAGPVSRPGLAAARELAAARASSREVAPLAPAPATPMAADDSDGSFDRRGSIAMPRDSPAPPASPQASPSPQASLPMDMEAAGEESDCEVSEAMQVMEAAGEVSDWESLVIAKVEKRPAGGGARGGSRRTPARELAKSHRPKYYESSDSNSDSEGDERQAARDKVAEGSEIYSSVRPFHPFLPLQFSSMPETVE